MPLRDELAGLLAEAMRQRDRPVISALRTALGELANAEAVPAAEVTQLAGSQHVAGAAAGVGAAEAARRIVPEAEARAIVERSRAELAEHAARLTRLCRLDEADGVRRASAVLADALAATPAPAPAEGADVGPDAE